MDDLTRWLLFVAAFGAAVAVLRQLIVRPIVRAFGRFSDFIDTVGDNTRALESLTERVRVLERVNRDSAEIQSTILREARTEASAQQADRHDRAERRAQP